MRHIWLILFGVLAFGWFNLHGDVANLYACSGGAPATIRGLIESSDYVVRAHPIQIDEAGQNAVLQVEQYLAGGAGPEYMLFTQNEPAQVRGLLEGRMGLGDCNFLRQPLDHHETLYLFLRRELNGNYEVVSTLFNPEMYRFPTPESTIEVFTTGAHVGTAETEGRSDGELYAERGSGQQVHEREFIELIAEFSSEIPVEPNATAPYPRWTPIHMVSSEGTQYLLPVDTNRLVVLVDETIQRWRHQFANYTIWNVGYCQYLVCGEISKDGLNIARQRDDDEITVVLGQSITGQGFLFSPTSDTIAVWNGQQIDIYTLGYPRLGQPRYGIEQIASITIRSDNSAFIKQAAWSPDGRMLAYSDEEGLWLWDVYDLNSEPRLLLPATDDGIPFAREFSRLGRYLAITQGNARYSLDLVNGDRLPDGIFSPDERILLVFDNQADTPELVRCTLLNHQSCETQSGFFQNSIGDRYYLFNQILQIEWLNQFEFVVAACSSEFPEICGIARVNAGSQGLWGLNTEGFAFDYSRATDSLLVIKDAHTLVVEGEEIDLSTQLDGEIVSAQWLPTFFYRHD